MVQLFPPDFAGFIEAYIALGSNIGDRGDTLQRAIEQVAAREDIFVERVSHVYETDPVGYTDQPAFLNMAAAVKTRLGPEELLDTLLAIEQQLGRVRLVHWGPRTIDLDLLMYGDISQVTERLTIPHPRMMERAFVLVPLRDVLTETHPLHAAVAESANLACRDGKEGITRWKTTNWHSASAHFES
ncbi:2-amino-4-hydroxy-6-hydroxymethyldihydropteridine diphosphokinase [Paenibacillus sp. MMS18-CY102]|uniref:2-amino-4-hydroxy-6- hydroxymethyldihydropteridine diphosphokinase n=1 Tax=Paenibacillus sp. MMS18-CY102 TaxID=2682849 RepID=UPI001366421E|nr:2-amino-4-hydroxy-6-hydroxymethyldihydropteridine diphosphokinase [Paenibacillus sp. MMS18-CY102]MWC30202.1 2-amino-4-hydroxy-6-hydroxymethyldihydropteridine diphosphokinase [Paenibacillus sp. MMS18-CY102]